MNRGSVNRLREVESRDCIVFEKSPLLQAFDAGDLLNAGRLLDATVIR